MHALDRYGPLGTREKNKLNTYLKILQSEIIKINVRHIQRNNQESGGRNLNPAPSRKKRELLLNVLVFNG